MTREAVVPGGHSPSVARYSPGLAVELRPGARLLAISGQVATDAVGTLVAPDAAGQAEAVFDRIEAVLRAAGGDLGDLVSLSVFLLEPHDFGAVSAVRDARLREPPPASTLVYVSGFVEMGVRVEISGLAMIDGAGARG